MTPVLTVNNQLQWQYDLDQQACETYNYIYMDV